MTAEAQRKQIDCRPTHRKMNDLQVNSNYTLNKRIQLGWRWDFQDEPTHVFYYFPKMLCYVVNFKVQSITILLGRCMVEWQAEVGQNVMNVNARKQLRLNENFPRIASPCYWSCENPLNPVRLTLESSKIIRKRRNRIESDHMKIFVCQNNCYQKRKVAKLYV